MINCFQTKLGGVIVESSILKSSMILNVGCGLNLSNEEPTLSVNQLVTGLGAPSVSREEYLAHLFNALHSLITSFNAGHKQHVFEEIMIMDKERYMCGGGLIVLP